jgi:LuxR family maltose regulon positive regulatory protein
MPGIIVPSFILLAKAKRAKGDIAGAFRELNEARKLLTGKQYGLWNYHLDIYTAALYLRLGDTGNAAKFIDTGRIGLYDPLSDLREYEYTVYARYLMRTNRPDDALILIGRLADFARKQNQLGCQIELECLEAVCHDMKGDNKNAMTALDEALTLGMKENYIRTFADEGAPMYALLGKYLSMSRNLNGRHLSYARSLLKSAYEKAPSQKASNGIAGLLTEREIGVVKLLAEHKSNKEIAGQLFFSVSAVKRYNTKIFNKLGAKNRREVITKARELGLIE